MVKQIVVGEYFRLPKVSDEKFKELTKVMEYKVFDGKSEWGFRISEENWEKANEVLSKYFTNFEIVFKCCGIIWKDYELYKIHKEKLHLSKIFSSSKHYCPECGEEMEDIKGEPFRCKCGYEGLEFTEEPIRVRE
jgi:tRNA(Ile2) C34 agmatinyltransferase TiaS